MVDLDYKATMHETLTVGWLTQPMQQNLSYIKIKIKIKINRGNTITRNSLGGEIAKRDLMILYNNVDLRYGPSLLAIVATYDTTKPILNATFRFTYLFSSCINYT